MSTVIEAPLRRRVGSGSRRDISIAYSTNTGTFVGSATIRLDDDERVPAAAQKVLSEGGSTDFLQALSDLL